MDEGKRDSKPRSHNVYTLDGHSAGEREDNSRTDERGHEDILRPESDTRARHRDRLIGNVEHEKP